MASERPFSDPISVGVAGAGLLAIAAASFASGLSHQLRAPPAETVTAQVVVMPARPDLGPPPSASLAYLDAIAPPAPAPKPAAQPHRHVRAPMAEPDTVGSPLDIAPAAAAGAATAQGVDAAATSATASAPAPAPPSPAPPQPAPSPTY
jgi:hypothetical protein